LAVANTGPAAANEGDSITYTVTVTNNDPNNPGTGVVLTDTLDANLRFISATTSQGTFSQSGGKVTFNVGTIANGGSATVTVTAQALEDGALTNSASVAATSADPTPGNNSAAASTLVAEPAIVVSAPITTTSKKPTNVVVATFTHAGGVEPTSAFTATINWGDGKTSTGTITQSGTTYSVTGSHRYSGGGTHTVTTTVTEIGSATQLLLGKIGDETPDLPDHWSPGHDHDDGHASSKAQVKGLANLLGALLGQSTPPAGSTSGSGGSSGGTAPISPDTLDRLLASIKKQSHGDDELASLEHYSGGGQFDSSMLALVSLLDDLFFDPHG
jgi:uncharacterized repeat protein (TIGR01451 family)